MSYYLTVLKKYAVFEGRARRSEYWYFILCNLIVIFLLAFVAGILSGGDQQSPFFFLVQLYNLAVLLPTIAVAVRRLHDTGRSGWWIFIGLIPLVGAIVLIVFYVQDSDAGDNAYGPNPKAAPMS